MSTHATPGGTAATAPLPWPASAAGHPALQRLVRAQHRLRRAERRRPWRLDTAVVLLAALAAVPDLVRAGGAPSGPAAGLPPGGLAVLAVLLVSPLWWRRRAPAAVFAAVAPGCAAQFSLGLWAQGGFALLVALYGLALRGSPRALGAAAGATVTGVWLSGWFVLAAYRVPFLILLTGTTAAAVALGLTFRIRGLYLAALEDRAVRLETERDQRARLTAAAERARIAREMHDIVGHNLSVIVGLADGAAALAANRGDGAAEPLRLIGDTGRQALVELRRVLGVLRDEPGARPADTGPGREPEPRLVPQPGIGDLDALLGRVRAAGLSTACRTAGDLAALGDGLQLTVYRIVQEALTNTLKHAGPEARAEVAVEARDGRVRVRVTDTGPPPGRPARPAPDGEPGHGLAGIRRRAALYGGSVTIGPRGAAGGWTVDVLLDAPPPGEPAAPAPGGRP
ncbi:sensor histidine kinase [Actinomadura sp. WAC 06369]|uniref:sensor histidine kinase n=1 Tax=Actinomadura sp. WAC 06369 TaxID=2203193 RepID=UPI000F7A1DC9|nr:histidine kinase [Actinomadura sp. WAC 06369]RSN64798.1 two-component sensor histidine kinase [Actinomadura sp. WAC 06369]